MKTERLTILVTPEEKAALSQRASEMEVSAGEFVRMAISAYDATRDEALIEALACQLAESVDEMNASLDRTNARIERTVRGLRERREARERANSETAREAA